VLVAGLGRAGEAALQALIPRIGCHALAAWDAMEHRELRARAARWRSRGVHVTLGGDGTNALGVLGSLATVVKSPGIDMDAPLLRVAASQGVEVVDELEIGWRMCRAPLVAVTGTNGKSTTCAIIASVLSADGRTVQRVGNTEFGPPLSRAAGVDALVCEVSSFQLEAAPTFLPESAVFTNLSLEHLPRHKTMEAYGHTKQLMFVREGRTCGIAVVNADDAWGRRIIAAVHDVGGHAVSYGFSSGANFRIVDARWTMSKAQTMIWSAGRTITLHSHLPGRHNALNIAAAVAHCRAAGLDPEAIVAGVESAVAPPGRCELIDEGQPFDVVVDYAHTPDGVTQFLSAVRTVTSARGSALRTVFGAVGLPDPPKAQGCGEAVGALSDHLVLTTGSAPRSPRIERLRELRDAAQSAPRVDIVLDRRKAIERAILAAAPGDVVAILGLGALTRLILDAVGTVCPFDDRQAARDVLQSLMSCAS
jgi:UDP-N-acetylmuramoyl-L-alanyl-D-glutamate--2,6-diaminopimelate ligase